MTKTKKVVIGALISLVTLGGLITYASPGESCGRHGGMNEKRAAFIVNRISDKLDLNDVQKQNLITLKNTLKAQKEKLKEGSQKEALMALLAADALDETKVLAMMDERITQFRSAAPTVVSAIADFTNSLNSEQRDAIRDFAEKMQKHRGKPFGIHH